MASTYSQYKLELIGTGEQAGTWGTTTNNNLGSSSAGTYQGIEQAIGGKATVTFSSTTETLTLTDSNAAQNARALYLDLGGTPGGAATLEVPAIQKSYIVKNGTTGGFAVTVKVSGQTGVAVPVGATMWLYNNGTDVTNAITNLPSGATVGGVAIGTTSGTVTSVSGTGTVNGISLSGTVTSSGNITLGGALTGVDLTSQVTGTLPVANGGTGITSFGTGIATFLGTPSSSNLAAAVTDETGTGALVFGTSPTLVTPALGTPSSGTLTNCTADGTNAVGFKTIPQNVQTGNYTLVLGDSGKHIYRGSGSAATWTIPANSSVAYPIGTALTFINLSATSVSIAITSDTMYLSSDGTTGTRTLAQYGSATAVKIASTTWIISGSGLT